MYNLGSVYRRCFFFFLCQLLPLISFTFTSASKLLPFCKWLLFSFSCISQSHVQLFSLSRVPTQLGLCLLNLICHASVCPFFYFSLLNWVSRSFKIMKSYYQHDWDLRLICISAFFGYRLNLLSIWVKFETFRFSGWCYWLHHGSKLVTHLHKKNVFLKMYM